MNMLLYQTLGLSKLFNIVNPDHMFSEIYTHENIRKKLFPTKDMYSIVEQNVDSK